MTGEQIDALPDSMTHYEGTAVKQAATLSGPPVGGRQIEVIQQSGLRAQNDTGGAVDARLIFRIVDDDTGDFLSTHTEGVTVQDGGEVNRTGRGLYLPHGAILRPASRFEVAFDFSNSNASPDQVTAELAYESLAYYIGDAAKDLN